MYWPANGEYAVPSYQMSALPYLTSSIISLGEVHVYEFPLVTRFINIVNRGAVPTDRIAVAFTANGLKPTVGNFIVLNVSDALHEEIRTTRLYVSGSNGSLVDYQLFCGLTNIPFHNFLTLTASNGHSGVG